MGVPKEVLRGAQLPDLRRPARMPSCPAWVKMRLAFLKYDHQSNSTGKYRQVPTMPATKMLSRQNVVNSKTIKSRLRTFVPFSQRTQRNARSSS